MGYAALCIDTTVWTIRGAEGFRANQLTTNQATIDFFEDAIRILDQRGLVDPQRVAVSGFSGSATGIAWGLVHSKAFTAAIITTRSGTDPIVCYLATMAGTCRRAGQRAGLSPPYDPVAALPTDSPALGAAAITTPLLMQLAEAEYLDNLQLHAALSDLDRPVELRVFPGEFHMKRQPRHRLAVYERNVQWIDFWCRGRRVWRNLSVQYKRWREQRELHCQRIANLQEAASRPGIARRRRGEPDLGEGMRQLSRIPRCVPASGGARQSAHFEPARGFRRRETGKKSRPRHRPGWRPLRGSGGKRVQASS